MADTSEGTSWSSDQGVTPVTTILGFSTPTPLSKVFVNFTTNLPNSTVLEFRGSSRNNWQPLQYFALDCMESFGISPNEV